MSKRRCQHFALLSALAVILIPVGFVLRSQRSHEALNRQLIAALVKSDRGQPYGVSCDDQEALALVNAGADPNAPFEPPPAPSLGELWNYLVHRSPLPSNHSPSAFLIVCGALFNDPSNRGIHIFGDGRMSSAPLVQLMIRHGANVETKDENGFTALLYAAASHNVKTLDVLLEHGVDVNAKVHSAGGSPLFWAVDSSDSPTASPDEGAAQKTVQRLLAHGADPNLPGRKGRTPLQIAQRYHRSDIVALLKAAGAKD
ncbi:MAG: putative ankyrin repeat-containing protein [Chthonomonadales bacterium]|nr:putative ankyrin repeat-containing protein [Chthonomonadales bacterium]